ncbi:FAD-binding oxidoreductase [Leeia sp. TBRC 13508]|uniref:FAD-binding oxidoreductase n=1 Tax=Leeia speluncae TaxID=2884804 RepID=A0ABS8DAD8_9NEIS|nr:FAD-binding oxidoreductase [Leeia speluncae]MCB6185127.1 FAD-binding oxidoreductase [Leeia speluncae]
MVVQNKSINVKPPQMEPTDSGWYLTSGDELPLIKQNGDVTCECLVIGAGWMGLHAARRYAELRPEAKVVLVDAGRIGNNASGRCMGFAIDLSHNPRKQDFVEDDQGNRDELYVNTEGNEYLKQAVEELGVDCDWDPQGKYHSAATESGVNDLKMFSKALDRMGQKYSWVEKDQMKEMTGSNHYIKALHHPGTILIQPAKYLKNMARVLPSNVTVLENTVVKKATFDKSQHTFETQSGIIRAKKVIICTAGYLQNFGFYPNSAIPVYTFASMTRQLTEHELAQVGNKNAFGLIPANSFGTTVRRTVDNRLFLRNVYHYADHFKTTEETVMNARKHQQISFERRWPDLASMGFVASWGGLLTLSQNGGMVWGELAPNVYGAAYCNGTGISRGTGFGKAIAELALGMNSRSIDILKRKAPPSRGYPRIITSLGVKFVTGWRFKQAGKEI